MLFSLLMSKEDLKGKGIMSFFPSVSSFSVSLSNRGKYLMYERIWWSSSILFCKMLLLSFCIESKLWLIWKTWPLGVVIYSVLNITYHIHFTICRLLHTILLSWILLLAMNYLLPDVVDNQVFHSGNKPDSNHRDKTIWLHHRLCSPFRNVHQ